MANRKNAQVTVLWSSIARVLEDLCKDKELIAELQPFSDVTNGATECLQNEPSQSAEQSNKASGVVTLEQWPDNPRRVSSPLRPYLDLSLVIAFLRDTGRQGIQPSPAEIEVLWTLVQGVLTETSIVSEVYRSDQGFFGATLWRTTKDSDAQEVVQLQIWLPDDKRRTEEISVVHSYQQFGQIWVLLGQGQDCKYEVHPAESTTATHAVYEISQGDDVSNDKAYRVDQKMAKYVNTGKLVRASEIQSEAHLRYTTYHRDAGAFHRLEVKPDEIHVIFCFLDSQRGFKNIAPVLGPVGGEYYQEDDLSDTTPASLVAAIEAFRDWERFYQRGLGHSRGNELEEALLDHRSALAICDSNPDFPQATHFRYLVLTELGYVYRMLGRFLTARDCLQEAVHEGPRNESRLKALGELAVVYRHLDRLDDAKRTCEEQYETAKYIGSEPEMERAIGNLGMVNYQLFLLNHEQEYLNLAIKQLEERVDICRRLRAPAASLGDSRLRAAKIQTATAREAIAFARLSLCYTVRGDIDKAVRAALECQELSFKSGDPSKIAFSRFFYGRALLLNGQKEDALAQFNPLDGYTPIAALCKEPCEEYRGYIREMIDAGADVTLRDRSGYSALDYAVYSNDTATQVILVEALRRVLSDEQVEQHRLESTIRKGYREVFQDKLRPVLLQADGRSSITQLRQIYARTLAMDEEKERQFDTFKYVRFTDFIRHGRLPKSTHGLTRAIGSDIDKAPFVIFISYTWTKKIAGNDFSPDDAQNTKYHQMINAVQSFLQENSDIDPETVCVWLDWACIDQLDPELQSRGVAALPMSIAQCNAMISIVSKTYYERAWCCVEVITIQALQGSYDTHWWFEYEFDTIKEKSVLKEGRVHGILSVASANVTMESDRPTLMFLERQAKLLGNVAGA